MLARMVSLRQSKLFSGVLAEELQALEQTAVTRAYKPGQVVFQEGDEGDGIYLIIEGKIQISALIGQNERRVLGRLGPGEFFGEMAVLDAEPRSATVSAEQDTRVYFIPRQDMLDMLEHSPKLAVSLVREFSLRMREFNRQYIQESLQAERLTLVGRFARSIVHDFKNPLNIIGISAEMAAMQHATPEMRVNARDRIRRQVERLSNMINELLEFTRGSQASMVFAETDFAAFVRHLVDEMQPEVATRGATIHYENQPPPLWLLLDPKRLTHVFYNLVHNSVDAMAPAGGPIYLRFIVEEKELVVEIQDTGKGIAPEIAPRLFEAFATHGKAQGTGLGLSICKRIIEDHHGRISARNAPGHGAIFSFTLPLQQ